MAEPPNFGQVLEKAVEVGIFGTKMRSLVKLPIAAGIKAVAAQQFDMARRIMAKGLVPILMPEVDIHSPQKAECELMLLDALMEKLGELRSDERVIFWLTLPSKPDTYMPLMGHPNTIRVVALSGGYEQADSCRMLKENAGMVAGFSRALLEGLTASQSDKDFGKALDDSCESVFQVSRRLSIREMQTRKVNYQDGFFVAFDQVGSSRDMVLQKYGYEQTQNEHEALRRLHAMHMRIFAHPKFNGSRVIGVFVREDCIGNTILGVPLVKYLWEKKQIVTFVDISRGLEKERDGVLWPIDLPDLEEVLANAADKGVFGAKVRTVIKLPHAAGIRAAVDHQFQIAGRVLAKGLVPILHLEVDINSPDKATCERILRQAVMGAMRKLNDSQKIMLELTLPEKSNMYAAFIDQPHVLRVMASSGGYEQAEACRLLAVNAGVVGAFGRAFFEGLSRRNNDKEFVTILEKSSKHIYQASRSAMQDTKLGDTQDASPLDKMRRLVKDELIQDSRILGG